MDANEQTSNVIAMNNGQRSNPDRLEAADFAYFQRATAGLAFVQMMGVADGAVIAQAVVNFVQGVIADRYGLKNGDQITPDGTIVRA